MNATQKTSKSSKRAYSPHETSRFVEETGKDKVLIKDHNYFRDRSWNNSYLASGKIYSFYHNKENELLKKQAELKEEMRLEQAEAIKGAFEERAIANRQQALNSLMAVTRQRMNVQIGANQPVLDAHFEGIQCLKMGSRNDLQLKRGSLKVVPNRQSELTNDVFGVDNSPQMLRLMNRKPSLLWNKVTKLNEKNLDLLLTPEVIKRDRKAFEDIKNRRLAEEQEKELLAQQRKQLHDSIRWKGKLSTVKQGAVTLPNKTDKRDKFIDFDDPALNGLLMNDVLRVRGVVKNNVIQRLMRSNSLLKTLKEKSTAENFGTLKKNSKGPASRAAQKQQSNLLDDEYFKIKDVTCDIEPFEEGLKRLNKFKEARYPRINLDRVNRYLNQSPQ